MALPELSTEGSGSLLLLGPLSFSICEVRVRMRTTVLLVHACDPGTQEVEAGGSGVKKLPSSA